ncbi:hypothetical protein [Bacillus cereus]|uniref:hypothetical protein n=1 Tax=Bacillus cereus TaxID=1396 RepID=UPI0011A0F744|nr:hypothetical protein [Bacillus cereus]
MIIETLNDIVEKELDSQYNSQEKNFEAKNFTVYIATHRENKLANNQLVLLNYSPLNVLTDCLKWEIPKYRSLVASNSLGYHRSSYG